MPVASLFSGGKDCTYVIQLWYESTRTLPDYLIFIEPKWESPHLDNAHLVKQLAQLLNIKLITCKASELERVLMEYNIDTLLAADVYVVEHVKWLSEVCMRTGTELVEPIWGYDTEYLLREIVESGISFIIIGSRPEYSRHVLGMIVNKHTIDKFLEKVRSLNIDPLGESGEYHTLTLSTPLLRASIEVKNVEYKHTSRYDVVLIKEYSLKTP